MSTAERSAPGAAARERLVELRRSLIAALDSECDAGFVTLLGSVHLAIQALDAAVREDRSTTRRNGDD